MPRFLAVFRLQECLNEIPGNAGPNGTPAHAKNIHVVVFDALLCGKMIVNQRGSHSRHFVGTHRSAHAAAANRNAAVDFAGNNSASQGKNVVGIVVGLGEGVSAEIDNFVPASRSWPNNSSFNPNPP